LTRKKTLAKRTAPLEEKKSTKKKKTNIITKKGTKSWKWTHKSILKYFLGDRRCVFQGNGKKSVIKIAV